MVLEQINHSCITILLAALDRWKEALEKGNNINAVYLDFVKAFDSVQHKKFLLQLKGYGIDKNTLNWIEAFLSDCRQRGCIKQTSSAEPREKWYPTRYCSWPRPIYCFHK